jgi:hypothetical protein
MVTGLLLARSGVPVTVLEERGGELKLPLALRVLRKFPVLARLPARMIGLGVRPEHIRASPAP